MNRMTTKVLRDLWMTRGRVLFMMLALASGLTAMGSVLATRSIIRREMNRAYKASEPASATFDVGDQGINDDLFEQLRHRPEVARAERRATREARWRLPGNSQWGRALIFVAEDYDAQQLALIGHEQGPTSPATGHALVERSAMPVLQAEIGDTLEVRCAGGPVVPITVAGVVHEPALAPASTEQSGYLYVSLQTFARLQPGAALDEVRVVVTEDALQRESVVRQVTSLASWLEKRGVNLHEVRVPPPAQHPHQRPSETVLLLFGIFCGLTVLLGAVLSAALMAIAMARQVREVAVMKTLGGTTGRIRRMYVLMLGIVSVGAILVSALPAWGLGRLGASAVANLLNFDVQSYAVPWWVVAVQVAVGLLLPLLTATPSIVGASRVTVRQALDEHGSGRQQRKAGKGRLPRLVRSRLLRAALRNALRRPRRLLLTIGLLAVAGMLFITAASLAGAWESVTDGVYRTRFYDIELHFPDAMTPNLLARLQREGKVEVWGVSPATPANDEALPISRTYPDGAHGLFKVVGVPDGTTMVDFPQLAGRWLQPADQDGVVLNQVAAARFGRAPVGSRVSMVVDGKRVSWQVVGVVEEVASPATAYVSVGSFVARTGLPLRTARIDLPGHAADAATQAAAAALENELSNEGTPVAQAVPLEKLFNAMGEHMVVLIRSLMALALLMALVGILALGATMSISVVERTRENGVLQAIGARPRQVRWMILFEGWFVALLSLPAALLLALPLAAFVGIFLGNLTFLVPLPLFISWPAVAGWDVGALLVATAASFLPALAATRMPVREALSHV